MVLSYKNYATKEILTKLRNIRYSEGEMLFGYYNVVDLNLDFCLDLQQISLQADVAARTILTYRSVFDLKRFLGSYQEDWLRLLHEAYIYDVARCIYYGINSINIFDLPNDSYAFPGHVMLLNALAKNSFKYDTGDSQPFSLYVQIKYSGDANTILKPLFDVYPDIKEGLSDNENIISYVNSRCESILKGLFYAQQYLETRKTNKISLYQMVLLNDETVSATITGDSNPIFNSFLSKDLNKFYFILPASESSPNALRFNESVFIGRAIGFVSDNIQVSGNNYYVCVKRNKSSDQFTRDEVYAITGLKSEVIPYSQEQIKEYLGINSYKFGNGNGDIGGSEPNTP